MQIPQIPDFKKVVFFTGAGMSAESGVPTYRGQGGIWKQYDYQRYACQQAFDRDPAGVWEFHNYRRQLVGPCRPHAGHAVLVAAQHHVPDVAVVTQNIDGMHQKAGSTVVIELHGSLWRVRCDGCGARHASQEVPLVELRCGDCGAWWRPDIVWFGDMLDGNDIAAARRLLAGCQLMVAVGTSAVVYPAADLPRIARAQGATLVEINPEPTPLSGLYDVHLRVSASAGLLSMARGLPGF